LPLSKIGGAQAEKESALTEEENLLIINRLHQVMIQLICVLINKLISLSGVASIFAEES